MKTFLPLIAAGLCLGACMTQPAAEPEMGAAPRVVVSDLRAFDDFIATRPTPEQLRDRYPGLLVVMPGQIATKELRTDNSRYFVDLDEAGRVRGGRFQ